MLMDQVETLHVCGYWSEILCCTITTHLSDIEVKVMGHSQASYAVLRQLLLVTEKIYAVNQSIQCKNIGKIAEFSVITKIY